MIGRPARLWSTSRFDGFPLWARIAVMFALLGVVTIASTSRGGGGSHGSVPSSVLFDRALLAFAGTAVVTLVLIGLTVGGFASLAETRRLTKLFVSAIALLLLATLVATFSYRAPGDRDTCTFRDEILRRPGCVPWNGHSAHSAGGGSGVGGSALGPIAAAAALSGGLVLLMGVAFVVALRHRRRLIVEKGTVEDPLAQAVHESLDDLRRERDIRRAIIACYARMERALALGGAGRHAHEAPFEFLARVLERVAHEPGRALTELFERAKFSREPMGSAEKERAITALEALRSEVSA